MFNLKRIVGNMKHLRGYAAGLMPPNFMTILDNGIRVATEETSSPLVAVSFVVEAGPRFENCSNNGISHFIEHMAFKGLSSLPQTELENKVSAAGARIWTKTGLEVQRFTGLSTPNFTKDIIAIFGSILSELEINQQKIEDEIHNISCELREIDNNPKKTIFEYLHSTAYQGTNMGQTIIGPSTNIGTFDAISVRTFLSEHYQPWRIVIAASGGIKHSDMVKHVSESFGSLHAHPTIQRNYGCVRYTGSQVMFRDDSLPHCHVAMAVEAPGLDNLEGWLSMMLARELMGSWSKNQGGRINAGEANVMTGLARAASHDGLCEGFHSFYKAYRDTGLWGIYFVGNPLLLEDMVANIQDEWLKMCTLATHTDFLRAKCRFEFNMMRATEGCVKSCNDLGMQILRRCHRYTLEDMCRILKVMNSPNWLNMMYKCIYDKCPVIASVGPSEALPEYTRIRAGMYWLRI